MKNPVELLVDGAMRTVAAELGEPLSTVLSRELSLPVPEEAAGTGASTVLIDGEPALAAFTLVAHAIGKSIVTSSGLRGVADVAHPLHESFERAGLWHIGPAVNGLVVSCAALLAANPRPTAEDVLRGLAGNICEGTDYADIVDAVLEASTKLTDARTIAS